MLFMDPEGRGRRTLFNVLVNYSQYNPVVGYCQGMSYIAAIFLMHFSEEETFWCMASLLSSSNYMLNCEQPPLCVSFLALPTNSSFVVYDEGLSELMVKSKVFMELLEAREPSLSSHLVNSFFPIPKISSKQNKVLTINYSLFQQTNCGMDPLMYITPWFMRMFTSFDDWDLVLFTFGHTISHGSKISSGFFLFIKVLFLIPLCLSPPFFQASVGCSALHFLSWTS